MCLDVPQKHRVLFAVAFTHLSFMIKITLKCAYFNILGHLDINPLNPELNPMCCLLALLGAHHFLHVSRIRVKSLTFR